MAQPESEQFRWETAIGESKFARPAAWKPRSAIDGCVDRHQIPVGRVDYQVAEVEPAAAFMDSEPLPS